MCTFTAVDVENPWITLGVAFASKTCFISMEMVEFPAIGVRLKISTPSNRTVKVAEPAAVLTTTILVTTAVVPDVGTVYSAPMVVAKAVLAKAFVTVAINYYFLL
jgi:hypothetical protein